MELQTFFSLDLNSFFDFIKTIRYGYQDRHGSLHFESDPDFAVLDYVFSSAAEVVSNACGWCWDVANLIGMYCEHRGIEHITLFMEYRTPELHQTHTQVFLKQNMMWYPAPDNSAGFPFGSGAHEDFETCREQFVNTFRDYLKYVLKDRYDESRLLINPITKPIPSHISDDDYLELVRNC